jgi:hypothetical protein
LLCGEIYSSPNPKRNPLPLERERIAKPARLETLGGSHV